MSAIRIQVLFYFCSLICLVAQGQSLTISGKIIDANSKEPISFASVYVKNTAYGSISDSAGNYVLTLPKLYDTLSVFFTGYKEKNIAIPKKSNIIIDISLEPESNSLSEVVVFAKREPIEEIILRHIKIGAFFIPLFYRKKKTRYLSAFNQSKTMKKISPIIVTNYTIKLK